MPLVMDLHDLKGPVTLQKVAEAHAADPATPDQHGVHHLRYGADEANGRIFCLVDAPDAEAATTVHREAHGLVADEVVPSPRANDRPIPVPVRTPAHPDLVRTGETVTTDPLTHLVQNRQADLMADARRSVLAREARRRTARPARIRSTAAGLLFAAAARLEASAARPHPSVH